MTGAAASAGTLSVVVKQPGNGAVTGNAISGNGGLGIDLGGDGITENDSLDVDSGPNDLLNAPVISTALERFGTVTVDYLLDVPAGTYRVEFFTNTGADGFPFQRIDGALVKKGAIGTNACCVHSTEAGEAVDAEVVVDAVEAVMTGSAKGGR